MTSRNQLLERYDNDPLFHAVVHIIAPGGWADDDGVPHDGPTVAGAQRVQDFFDALDGLGYVVVPKNGREIDRDRCSR